ncbi:MAG: HDIG domain-containing protein [Anaerolineae bacterium]|nr:HDIG domain-containing protein [Anaerolineae bacterium]
MHMDHLNREHIWQLVCEYTENEQLRKHMLAVEATMKFYARKYGADEVLWGNIGLVHDFDYDKYPERHPFHGLEVLTEAGFPEEFLYTIRSHADYGDPASLEEQYREPAPRIRLVDKVLYAVDELTGLIMAVAYVRPSKKLEDVELSSIKKKWKDKAFARGAKREDIERGAAELGVPLDEHIQNVLTALKAEHETLGL